MKKLIYISLLLILYIFSSKENLYSQSGWFWQNPYPTGSHLEDIFFVNSYTGFAVGWNGNIIKTTNSGYNWFFTNSPTNLFYLGVYFTDLNNGYVISGDGSFPENNVLLKTTNGGIEWKQIYTFPNKHLGSICFVSSNTGFIVGGNYWWGGNIFKTTNSGINWDSYPTLQSNFMNSVYFINFQTGYIAGDDGKILKTTNQGINWNYLNSGTTSTLFNSITFIDSNIGFSVGAGGYICKTTNSGENWIQINSGTTTNLWSVKFINSLTGFIVGGATLQTINGKFLKTTNGGTIWDTINYSSNQNLYGLSLLNDSQYIAVGYSGTILKFNNFGNNYMTINQSLSNNNFNSIKFENNIGYIAGNGGIVLKTSNNGSNWTNLNIGLNSDLNSIAITDENNIFIAGNSGKILKTSNNGINWSLINLNAIYNLSCIKFLNSYTGFAIGYYTSGQWGQTKVGRIYKTTNSGNNWDSILSTNYHLYCIEMIDDNTGFASGFAGYLTHLNKTMKTTNCGLNLTNIFIDSLSIFNSIYFINSNTGFLCGRSSLQWSSYSLYKTTNSGNNWFWINIPLPYDFFINSIDFINNNTGFLACLSFPDYGRAGDIFKTTNSGTNWYHYSTISSYPTIQRRGLNSVNNLNDSICFVVGELGTILKTSNGGNPIAVSDLSEYVSEYFALKQNFPNPFNPSTTIKFDIPKSTHVQIVVYDMLGREVELLLNEEKKSGSYKITWDGSRFASGVYFYKLITDEYVETKKMVLIK